MNNIYFIGGTEPYLVDCQRVSLVGKLTLKELNYMEATCFSDEVYQFLYTYPIMDEKKVAYVSVSDLKDMDCPPFHEYMKKPSSFGVLIVRFLSADARTSFYKDLKKSGVMQLYDKESAAPKLADFILKRASKKGVGFEPGALELFLERENYARRDDITLYNLMGDLNNLMALSNPITKENVLAVIPDNVKDNVFGIARQIADKDIVGLRKQALLCKGNEIGTLSALLREYRIAYKAFYYSLSEIGASRNAFKGLSKDDVCTGIGIIMDAIDSVKHGGIPQSVLLEQTFLKLVYAGGEE